MPNTQIGRRNDAGPSAARRGAATLARILTTRSRDTSPGRPPKPPSHPVHPALAKKNPTDQRLPRTGWVGPDRKRAKVDPAHPAQETERRAGWTGCKTAGIRSGPGHPAPEMVNRTEPVRPNGPDGPDQNPEMGAPAREGVPLRGARRRRDRHRPPLSLPTTARRKARRLYMTTAPQTAAQDGLAHFHARAVLRDRQCPCDDARRRNPG